MSKKIGLLLPRSGEYPSMSFDLNDGFRLGLIEAGISDIEIISDNSGFGNDLQSAHSKAEKLVMSDDVAIIVAYMTSLNAESLYEFSKISGKPILFLDAGMEIFEAPKTQNCYHLTLQGLHGCYLTGIEAGNTTKKIIAATSFYDGGYRGPYALFEGMKIKNSTPSGNFVSVFKPEEFSIDNLLSLIQESGGEAVTACFSMYLTELFMRELKTKGPLSTSLPFYCSPFMAEEMWLEKCDFPGGTFHTIVPWALDLDNPAQTAMKEALDKYKNKKANLFSLLGWEAAHVVAQILKHGVASLDNWSFESPRGNVCFHPESHCSYAPLYNGFIEEAANGKSKLRTTNSIAISAEEHLNIFNWRIEGEYTRWRNNYFCI
jgi:branched-chain amino acid transport system substrate-binding protein